MIIIRSFEYLWRLGYYKPDIYNFQWESFFYTFLRRMNSRKWFAQKSVGTTGKINRKRGILYRYKDKLFFDYCKQRIEITKDTEIQIFQRENDYLLLSISEQNEVVLEVEFKPNKPFIPLEIDTTFVSASDFDFGIYVYETLLDKNYRPKLFKDYSYRDIKMPSHLVRK